MDCERRRLAAEVATREAFDAYDAELLERSVPVCSSPMSLPPCPNSNN